MQSEKILGRVLLKELEEKSVNEEFSQEDFWATHYALIKKFYALKKKALLKEGKVISSIENLEKEMEFYVVNYMTSLAKFKDIFGEEGKANKDKYLALFPDELPKMQVEDKDYLISLAGRIIAFATNNRLAGKDSGININYNKYKTLMSDYERDSGVINAEFLSVVEARFGKEGRENALSHIKEEGLDTIDALLQVYGEEVSYWCDFLANIEIARAEEEDKEWS